MHSNSNHRNSTVFMKANDGALPIRRGSQLRVERSLGVGGQHCQLSAVTSFASAELKWLTAVPGPQSSATPNVTRYLRIMLETIGD
jgi:hypothetical protein